MASATPNPTADSTTMVRSGTVQEFNNDKQRYAVLVDAKKPVLLLKPENLQADDGPEALGGLIQPQPGYVTTIWPLVPAMSKWSVSQRCLAHSLT